MLINGLKFSCATCIKGHRASSCKHTDRPLFEIRKKGRPVSQCLLCRDLRKTKQLHIKCICKNNNKKDNISKKSTEPCDCQDQQKNDPPSTTSSSSVKRLSPVIIPSQTISSSTSSTSSNSSSGSSPPYCWALVRPEENHLPCQIHSQQNYGYVFQKTNQERRRRLSKSVKGISSSSPSTSSTLLPNPISLSPSRSRPKKSPSTTTTITTPATSTLLDNYLATTNTSSLPLSRSLSSSSPTLDHDMIKELDDDLCNLLDNMIYQQQQQQQQQQQHQQHQQQHQQDDLSSHLSPTSPPPSLLPSSTTSIGTHSPSPSTTSSSVPPLQSIGSISNSSSSNSSRNGYQGEMIPNFYGQCQKLAQWHPQGPPSGQVGESVIITMTPLPKWNHPPQQQSNSQQQQQHQQQQQTTISTTKIVTCYCGPSCTCPGCLVHPTSSLFASQGLDPYAGYPLQHSVSSDED